MASKAIDDKTIIETINTVAQYEVLTMIWAEPVPTHRIAAELGYSYTGMLDRLKALEGWALCRTSQRGGWLTMTLAERYEYPIYSRAVA